MREIKFRGCNIDTGEFVFGDLRIIGIRPHIFKEAQCYYDEELIEVEPESVAQFLGYDKNGKEVYEGDTVVGDDGLQWDAEWSYILISDDGFAHLLDLGFFTLKEDDQ